MREPDRAKVPRTARERKNGLFLGVHCQQEGESMAKVIPFYVPASHKPKLKCVPPDQRGTVIEFQAAAAKRSA